MKQERAYLFSLAVSPDNDIIALVKELKKQLRKHLGRNYISANSLAHITLFSFWSTMDAYPLILEEFKRILSGLTPFELKFSGFDVFPPNPLQTFYIKPDKSSSQRIITYCSTINSNFRRSLKRNHTKKWSDKATKDVHMSVGHELSVTDIEKCIALTIDGFSESFFCDSFVIRRLNSNIRQYDIIDTIPLVGYQYISGEQLTLF